jgi:hypothetical protein
MNPRRQIGIFKDCFIRTLRFLANHPESWLLLILLILIGARLRPGWRPASNAFWLAPVVLGAAILGIYSMIYVEDRYIAVAYFAIIIPLFAALRISPSLQQMVQQTTVRTAASSAIFLLALLVIGESARIVGELRRNLPFHHSPAGWYDHDTFEAAHALNALGVGPGDSIACIGTIACTYDHYWARLAGVRILTEIYEPKPPLYPYLAAMPNRDQAYDILRRQGAKVLVGYFDPGLMTGTNSVSAGWRELDNTPFYALPLNLPTDATQNTHP